MSDARPTVDFATVRHVHLVAIAGVAMADWRRRLAYQPTARRPRSTSMKATTIAMSTPLSTIARRHKIGGHELAVEHCGLAAVHGRDNAPRQRAAQVGRVHALAPEILNREGAGRRGVVQRQVRGRPDRERSGVSVEQADLGRT